MKIRIKGKYIFLGLLLIVISEPRYFKLMENSILDAIFISCQIILGGLFSIYFLKYKSIKNNVSYYLILLDIWILLITILKDGAIYAALSKLYSLVILVFIYESCKKYKEDMITIFMVCMEIFIYIQLADVLIHPAGITDRQWILGGQNDIVRFLLPAYCVAVIYNDIFKKRLRTVLLICAINFIAILVDSSTTIVGILIMNVVYLFKHIRRLVDLKLGMALILVAFALIVISQNVFVNSIITSVFEKSITFHGRTPIWQFVIDEIMHHPIWGSGRGNFYINTSYMATHTHSFILEIAYRGGLIGIILLFVIVCAIIIKMEKFKKWKVYSLLTAAIFSFFVMGIVEVHEYHLMYLIFLLAYDIQEFAALEGGITNA